MSFFTISEMFSYHRRRCTNHTEWVADLMRNTSGKTTNGGEFFILQGVTLRGF